MRGEKFLCSRLQIMFINIKYLFFVPCSFVQDMGSVLNSYSGTKYVKERCARGGMMGVGGPWGLQNGASPAPSHFSRSTQIQSFK